MLALLELMATPRMDLHEKGGWASALEARGITHVTVNKPIRVTMEDVAMTGHTVRRLLGVNAATAASAMVGSPFATPWGNCSPGSMRRWT